MMKQQQQKKIKRTAANGSAKFIKGTLIQIKSIIEIIRCLNGFPRDGKLPMKI